MGQRKVKVKFGRNGKTKRKDPTDGGLQSP